jgi:hypothetical protein
LLKATEFDVSPLLTSAIEEEFDGQCDHEPEDDWNDVDDTYPSPPHDPLNDVDEEWPPPDPYNDVDDNNPSYPPNKKPRRPVIYEDIVRSAKKNLKGPHRRRAKKRLAKTVAAGQIPRASTTRDYVTPAKPIHHSFDATTLPAAHGGYAGKTEDKKSEKWGSKKPRSVTELIARGFCLIKWNGRCVFFFVCTCSA